MSLPNLLIVGAAKSGTTSLHEYLKQHPDIFMSNHKEPHFLINNDIGKSRVHRAVIDLQSYQNLFTEGKELKYRGESSVMYLLFPEISIANIKKYLGSDVKIIIMLRNPVERAYSGYQHNRRYNVSENLSFEEAIEKSEARYHKNKQMTPATRYLELGLYYNQVKMFKDNFKHVHVILYDDYCEDIDTCFIQLFNFLNLEIVRVNSDKKHMTGGWIWKSNFIKKILVRNNKFKSFVKYIVPIKILRGLIRKSIMRLSTSSAKKMNTKTKSKLLAYYKDDINKLSSLINRDLSHWLLK